jgi:hypothetical protein
MGGVNLRLGLYMEDDDRPIPDTKKLIFMVHDEEASGWVWDEGVSFVFTFQRNFRERSEKLWNQLHD